MHMDKLDYSIEYCHIYTNDEVGGEHYSSLSMLEKVTKELDQGSKQYNLCVMVDDYTFPGENFDYAKLLEWLESHDAKPHFMVNEADLIPSVDELLDHMHESEAAKLKEYIERKKYPCSAFIAAWYLCRLGLLQNHPSPINSYADRLINILPERFKYFEEKAQELIAKSNFADAVNKIDNIYLKGNTVPEE